MPQLDWNFPFWIAHRGAGKLAPENTLAAFRVGANHGYAAFECDVKLAPDGTLYLLHDETLSRTTNAQQLGLSLNAADHNWASLCTLDAGAWHSRAHVGEPLPRMEAIARHVQAQSARINWEIKPLPGTEEATGAAVAHACAKLWEGRSDWPLLSSFKTQALAGAQRAQPQVPRALLMDTFRPSWLDEAHALGCVAAIFNYALWTKPLVAQTHAAGLRALSYTVNDESVAQHLIALGTDGIITDRVDLFAPR
jgi:glycerophosphoryl diester phosphodiesterase